MDIGVDIDGVIADADTQFRKYMKKIFKRDFRRSEVKSFKYEECFEFTEYEFKKLYNLFSEEEIWITMEPIKGAIESLKKISKNNRIIIATSRPYITKEVTARWLKKYNVPYDQIHFTLDKKHLLPEATEYQFDFFLEDHPDFAQKIAKTGIQVLLFSYPWNESVRKHPKIRRVSGWDEVLTILNLI
jgi:uncharacterized HAD superfamily protein